MSFPITPSARPSGSGEPRAQPPGSRQSRQRPPQTFCKADEYLVNLVPNYTPMSEAELKRIMKDAYGATDETMQTFIGHFNDRVDEVMRGPGISVMGWKPQPGDSNFYSVRIPHSDYAIRMWDGGMEDFRQSCLDFYDTRRHAPVHLPRGFSLWPAPANCNMPGMFTMAGPLASWETAFGYTPATIPEGEEKWTVPEGACIAVRRDGRPGDDFVFAVPRRQAPNHTAIAQPQYGVAL